MSRPSLTRCWPAATDAPGDQRRTPVDADRDLALRAVEFTANPIAAYPRTITGKRTVEDGDIIEATAITLVPFPDTSGAANAVEARRAVARQIFGNAPEGVPQNILPIATP